MLPRHPRPASALARRHVLLFVVAIIAPSILLVALAFRMAAQERELAVKHRADERLRQTDNIRNALVGYLERVSRQATAPDRARAPASWDGGTGSPVALVARVDGDHLVLPWDERSSAAARPAAGGRFGEAMADGEREELIDNRLDRAADRFRSAVAAATSPFQKAYARLLLARVLTKGGHESAARTQYSDLLQLPFDVADEYGVPMWCYAAQRLVSLSAATSAAGSESGVLDEILNRMEPERLETSAAAPAVRHLLRELAGSIAARAPGTAAGTRARSLRDRLSQWADAAEQAEALERAFPLQGLTTGGSHASAGEAAWVLYGDTPWFVGLGARAPGPDAGVLVAIDAHAALRSLGDGRSGEGPRDVRLLTGSSRDGEWLGDGFPGVRISYAIPDEGELARKSRLQRWFVWAIVFLVLSVTASGGYFLWRDMRRELRLAALRAQFVSSVSHELKTPLTAIRMFAETLRMGRTADRTTAAEYLDTIVNESERLTRLLNNVLEFSKMERGTAHFRLSRQSIADSVQTAVRALSYPLAQQGFTLNVEIADAPPLVSLDADAIEQAVLNLLTNAMKYSGESRVIDLKVRHEGAEVLIEVVDYGIGIPPHEQEQIFEKFYRVATPQNRHIPGTGLGLTLVDHIARAHGGSIRVASQPGRGSTFTIRLPAAASNSEADDEGTRVFTHAGAS